MLKVLHIIPSLSKGGAERLALDICNGLIQKGYAEVLLVVMLEQNEYPELSENINIRYCNSSVIPSILGKSKINIDDFISIINDFEPDIIHSHLFEAEIMSRWITFPNIKYVSHCHVNYIQYKNFDFNILFYKSRLTDFYERNLILNLYGKCNNQFIAISHDMEIYLKKNIPNHIQNITFLHNAINYKRFKRKESFTKSITDFSNIKLINIGRFVDVKNQKFLIDVVKILNSKGYNVRLELIGEGPNKNKIENQIKEEGLTDKVYCPGNVNNVEVSLNNADIYVHSATYEPFGLVLIEAMAMGLPVVCLDGKGNRDVIENGKNGFILSGHNVNAYVSRIIDLIEDKELYKNISSYSQMFVMKYDIEPYIENLMRFYNKLIVPNKKSVKPLKVMHVIPSLEKGGAEKMVIEIAKHLQSDHNISVCIVTIRPENDFVDFSKDIKIINCNTLIETSIFRKSNIDITSFANTLNDFCPDIIHSHLYEAEILCRWQILPGSKYITHCHKNYEQLRKFSIRSFKIKKIKTILINYYERKFLTKKYKKCNNNFIAVSNDTLTFLQQNIPEKLQRLNMLHNAIDFPIFNKGVKFRKIESKSPIKLLTVGSLVNFKNQVFLVEVIDILIRKGYNVNLNIIGSGPSKSSIEQEIDRRGLSKNVYLTGVVDNIEDYYHNSDIYLHASLTESFCLAMLEANAAGLPVVCLDAKGNRDILKEGYNGFMIDNQNAESFADKVALLISDPDLYQKISENAVKLAMDFDIRKYTNRLVQFYKSLLTE